MPETLRQGIVLHGALFGAPLHGFVSGVRVVKLIPHVRQGCPGVVQLNLIFGDGFFVVAVLFPDFLQRVPVGFDDLLLLRDLLLQVLGLYPGLVLLAGVLAQLRSLGFQLAPECPQVAVRVL